MTQGQGFGGSETVNGVHITPLGLATRAVLVPVAQSAVPEAPSAPQSATPKEEPTGHPKPWTVIFALE